MFIGKVRRRTIVRLAAVSMCSIALTGMCMQTSADIDIPAQSLDLSLRDLGSAMGVNVLFDPKAVEGISGNAVRGQMVTDEAFARLLAGTGLKHRCSDERTITVTQ